MIQPTTIGADFELEIDSRSVGTEATYEFAVNGRIDGLDGTISGRDWIDGGRAGGCVNGGFDRYRIRGLIEEFDLDGQTTVRAGDKSVAAKNVPGLGHAGPLPDGYGGPGIQA